MDRLSHQLQKACPRRKPSDSNQGGRSGLVASLKHKLLAADPDLGKNRDLKIFKADIATEMFAQRTHGAIAQIVGNTRRDPSEYRHPGYDQNDRRDHPVSDSTVVAHRFPVATLCSGS